MKYVIGFFVGWLIFTTFPELATNFNPIDWFVDSGLRDLNCRRSRRSEQVKQLYIMQQC